MSRFPDPADADDDGFLCHGGDLSPDLLLDAYASGVFPWFNKEPILWWSPPERMVFYPDKIHVSRSLAKSIRRRGIVVRKNSDFARTIRLCAEIDRPGQDGTWITETMIQAYSRLHALGHAASYEAYDATGALAGALYGVEIGRAFFAESMCSTQPDGSKAVVAHLKTCGYGLIDAQFHTDHLESLGAELIPRDRYLSEIRALVRQPRP